MVATIDAVQFINGSARLAPDDIPLSDWVGILHKAVAEFQFSSKSTKRTESIKSVLLRLSSSRRVSISLSSKAIKDSKGGIPTPSLTYLYLGGSEALPDIYEDANKAWREGVDVIEKHLLLSATKKLFIVSITWRPTTKTQPVGVNNFEYEAIEVIVESDGSLEEYLRFDMRKGNYRRPFIGDETPGLRAYNTLRSIAYAASNEEQDASLLLSSMTKQRQRYGDMVGRFKVERPPNRLVGVC